MSWNREAAISEIRDALACPVNWAAVFRVEAPADFRPLESLWEEIVQGMTVDGKVDFPLDQETDADLRVMLINVRTWRERARRDYLIKTRRFSELRYVRREDHGKHLPPAGELLGPDAVEAASVKTGISKFYQEIPSDNLLQAFFHGLFLHYDEDKGVGSGMSVRDQALWGELMTRAHLRHRSSWTMFLIRRLRKRTARNSPAATYTAEGGTHADHSRPER